MFTWHLSALMDKKKVGLRVTTVAKETGINRSTLTSMYYSRAVQIDLRVLEILCSYFDCNLTDLLEHHPDASLEELKCKWEQDKKTRKTITEEKATSRNQKKTGSSHDYFPPSHGKGDIPASGWGDLDTPNLSK